MLGFEAAERLAGVGGAAGKLSKGERVVMTIEVPKGSKALNLSGVLDKHKTASNPVQVSAQELLLSRHTKFEVLKVEQVGSTRSIRVRAR